jgi:LuxR family maltose regulon positive regulatory protein
VVVRPRLSERLNEGSHRKLTLISAPAGFGKSTLLSTWIAGWDRTVAWLSLDEGDSDPTRFLTYVVSALRMVAPNIGEGVLDALQSPQPPPMESVLTALLNEISALPDKLTLVLDDYHVVDTGASVPGLNQGVDDALTFLLEHLPPQMHLVITTREDPRLPLARLRARNQLTELRADDLRFTPLEAARFLNQAMGLDLSEEDIDALEIRTEGWIAGLQLAALSMQSRQDVPAFIRGFAGDHRYIVDYLVEEVLQRQPESVRSFLLQTSILDRLNGSLCDAVTGQQGGSARLEVLERGNFFVVPLDDKRHWYRYHHLFGEVLYTQLIAEMAETAEQPEQLSALHGRASEWYEHNGSAPDALPNAIRHAVAAGDIERAANLVELAVPQMRRSSQEATMLGWLRRLPDELVRFRPVLSVGYAGALLAGGEFEGVEARLRDAERWLDARGASETTADMNEQPEASSAEMVVVDEEEFRRLPGSIAMYRAAYAMTLGDVPATVTHARRVLDMVPEDDNFLRGAAAALLGLASWASGDLEAAHRALAEGMASVRKAENTSDAGGPTMALADIRLAQGRLLEAANTYERALRLATQVAAERAIEQGAPVLRGTVDMYVGMSEIHRERNDLNAAMQHLLRSKQLGEHAGLPQNRYRWWVAMSRIREAQGDLDGALDALNEAERLYVGDFSPNVRPVPALRARVWLAQGRLSAVSGWARERGLSAGDDLSYLREFEHITLARLLLAQYTRDYAEHRGGGDRTDRSMLDAMGLLGRLLQAAEEGGRGGGVIEILILQALANQMRGDTPAALMPLERALALAEPEGYVRIFVDEGPPMAALLKEAAKLGIAQSYASRLLADFGDAGKAEGRIPIKEGLIEPLSARELEVLRLLRTELTGPEIARELTVSLHTLRTHTNNIYIKLGVNNRRAALRRAEDLGLL